MKTVTPRKPVSSRERRYLRLIDANLNRCREGMRVVEDTARFVLSDERAYLALRRMRHRLDELTRDIYPELLEHRDAGGDSGRAIREGKREGLSAVLGANVRRAQEALRVLEEYSRLISPEAGPEFKKLRYRMYDLEKNLLKRGR